MGLQDAVQSGDYQKWKRYSAMVNERPVATLRDLLNLKSVEPIPLDEVEPIENILPRFDSAGMSLGALSPEAHEALMQGLQLMYPANAAGQHQVEIAASL